MFNRPITKTYTLLGYLGNAMLLIIAGGVIYSVLQNRILHSYDTGGPIITIAGIVCLVVVLDYIWHRHMIRQHQQRLETYAVANRLSLSDIYLGDGTSFGDMAVSALVEEGLGSTRNYLTGNDWEYAEFTYAKLRHTRYGTYRSATVYYSVMTTRLTRALPNVFFDSKQSRGKQFRMVFNKNQCHSLEGDFDTFFTTYFPDQYVIDSMSFISPEVMWALRSASEYDIEITGNRLYLYGPLADPAVEIADMSVKLLEIKHQLLTNIADYRDERLPYDQGRQRVTPLGAELQRRKNWKYASLIFLILYIILEIARVRYHF